MAREIFSRYEKKYILDQEQYQHLSGELKERIELDPYNRQNGLYEICNLYYDTADDLLIRHSLEKPPFKEKLRLRSYGIPEADQDVFLELKKKYRGKVYKRRTKIALNEAESFVVDRIKPESRSACNAQVLDEIDFFIHRYQLNPAAYITYERMAFGRDDLRITFDRNIRTRRTELSLEKGMDGVQLLPEGTWLMEIKVYSSMPLWLSSLLADRKLYTESFSKYGREYVRYISGEGRDKYLQPDGLPQDGVFAHTNKEEIMHTRKGA